MLNSAMTQIKTAIVLLIVLTILTGLIYPGIVTVIAQFFFPWQANGSLIEQDGKIIGSHLIGQSFIGPQYFWGRPSATPLFPYNAESSSGSNLGPSNPDFISAVKIRIAALNKGDPQNHAAIPVELVTASGSGLDPEISPLAAMYQIHRIAKARRIHETKIQDLVNHAIKNRVFCLLGEQRINVLELNLALDNLQKEEKHGAPSKS